MNSETVVLKSVPVSGLMERKTNFPTRINVIEQLKCTGTLYCSLKSFPSKTYP